jgi:hypothetical protein
MPVPDNNINVSMIGDSVVAAIKDSVKTETIEVDGQVYTTRGVFNPPSTLAPDNLIVHTLTGLVDYVNNIARIDPVVAPEITSIHVYGPGRVDVCAPLRGRNNQRFVYLSARYDLPENGIGFRSGQFCDPETFTIALQSLFDDSGDVKEVLRLVGNMRSEQIKTTEDDGVTQVVGMRAGVVLKTEAKIPNPVILAPYRTFNEVEQPHSAYIFRVRENGDKPPLCALFCADGDAWKLAAIERIKQYLAEKITGIPIIA